MKKLALSLAIVAVIAVALGTAGAVYAQSSTPQTPVARNGYGFGMAERGGMMGQNAGIGTQDGLLHDDMIAVIAEKLAISVDDLNARLAAGETMSEIAASEGLNVDEFTALMADARSQAISAAVADGTLTQEQADWLSTRGARMSAGGRGMGARGAGLHQYANPDCTYYQTAQ